MFLPVCSPDKHLKLAKLSDSYLTKCTLTYTCRSLPLQVDGTTYESRNSPFVVFGTGWESVSLHVLFHVSGIKIADGFCGVQRGNPLDMSHVSTQWRLGNTD